MQEEDWTINSRASFLAIYLEGGRQLLGDTFARTSNRLPSNKIGGPNHKITFNTFPKLCTVPDMKTVGVTDEEQAPGLLAQSTRHGDSAATRVNK